MGLRDFLGIGSPYVSPPDIEVRSADAVTTSPITPPERQANSIATVTPSLALTLGSVLRAVSVIATAISQCGLDAHRGGSIVKSSPLLVRQPELDTPRSRTLSRTVISMALSGNAYWRIYRTDAGVVTSIEVLNPLLMEPAYDAQNRIVYDYSGYWNQSTQRFQGTEIRHLKLLENPGPLKALGPIQAARQTIHGVLALDSFSHNVFGEGGVPTGQLTTDQVLSPTQAAEWLAQWELSQERRKTAVLGQGLKYALNLIDSESLQLLDARRYGAIEVARMFGIPPHLMAAELGGSNLTYTTLVDYRSDFVTMTLMQYAAEIEGAFSALLPRGTDVRLNFDALLRGSTAQRYAAHAQAIAAGFKTVNEVRADEGLPPIEGGDVLRAPATNPAPQEAAA